MMNLAKHSVNHILKPTMLTRSQILNFSSDALKVLHNISKRQFFVEMNGEFATIDYDINGKKITFIHTEVPEVFRGKGVGKVLAEEAFSYASNNNITVKIECDFLQHYINTNKDKFRNLKIVS